MVLSVPLLTALREELGLQSTLLTCTWQEANFWKKQESLLEEVYAFQQCDGSLLRRQPGARRVLTDHVYIQACSGVCSEVKHKGRKH